MSASKIEPEAGVASVPESEKQGRPKGWLRRAILRRVQVWAILFVLYAMSIGPMFWTWYESKYLAASPWVALFYEPLLLLTFIPWFRDLINWWVDLWIL